MAATLQSVESVTKILISIHPSLGRRNQTVREIIASITAGKMPNFSPTRKTLIDCSPDFFAFSLTVFEFLQLHN